MIGLSESGVVWMQVDHRIVINKAEFEMTQPSHSTKEVSAETRIVVGITVSKVE